MDWRIHEWIRSKERKHKNDGGKPNFYGEKSADFDH